PARRSSDLQGFGPQLPESESDVNVVAPTNSGVQAVLDGLPDQEVQRRHGFILESPPEIAAALLHRPQFQGLIVHQEMSSSSGSSARFESSGGMRTVRWVAPTPPSVFLAASGSQMLMPIKSRGTFRGPRPELLSLGLLSLSIR